jgi:diguanylate cyclase (GGDEF)-like protein
METEKAKTAVQALRVQAQQLEHENQRLTQEASALSEATVTDPLTGLLNRRGLDAAMARAMIRRQETRAISIAVVDLDHFKRVNDSFSHLTGDEVLRAVGSILRSCCREGDVAARFGGEEFAVIFGKTSVEEARIACERMRSAIRGHDWQGIHPQLAVTASIGVADTTEAQGEALLALADRRLYAAKRAGRDRVVAEGSG